MLDIPIPDPGQLVSVRQRRFVVTEVQRGNLPTDPLADVRDAEPEHLVSLSSVEDDGLGEELQVIWELEPGARLIERTALPAVDGFDDPRRFDAFLNAVRWGAISNADIKALHAPFRSGITMEDYQLEPLVRALQMPRVNLLIADDVGLGKTIESGLVVEELMLRHRVRSVLVVCPAALQVQWRDQMRDKFGLEFRIVDSDLMKRLRRRRGIHVNPWTHFPRLITSIDYLKRDRPMRLVRQVLPADGQPSYPRKFDLLILDEAHNVAPAGTGRYAVDSMRTQAIRTIAPHFEHKLFLTATPHNGYTESWTALLELLDGQRFHRGVPPDDKHLSTVLVRRLKRELPPRWDGTPRYPKRNLEPIEVPHTEAERRVHLSLREYTKLRLNRAASSAEQTASEFVLKLLKKRLFSSPQAFATTLEKHEDTLRRGRTRDDPTARERQRRHIGILRRRMEGLEEEFADDDQYEQEALDLLDRASQMLEPLSDDEERLLAELRHYARRAPVGPDAKAQCLLDWIDEHLRPNGRWSDQRAIIFTEYRATQKWLFELFAGEGLTRGDRVMTLYGGMVTDDRERIKAAFQASPAVSPVRILLATDAASEGIDLQNHCHRLIHYEIPWNPNRLEQRNGRIDRHGQKSPVVDVFHFVSKGFQKAKVTLDIAAGDLDGDLEFLFKAAQKVERIREDLGKVGPVIAKQVEEAMLGRKRHLDTRREENAAYAVRRQLKFERNLRQRLAELLDQLNDTQRELHLSPEHIQSAVRVGLDVARHPPLIEAELEGVWPDPHRSRCPVFRLPPLPGSWARCWEGLRHPHTDEVRPIVFDNALAAGRDDVVLAHLNHRLVQMCLRLLRAQVWSPESERSLHRVTARLARRGALRHPVVVGHARLVVLGADNTRLHEEVIAAAGRLREGRFRRLNVGETQAAIEAGLNVPAPAPIQRRFLGLWADVADNLAKALEARMNDRTTGLINRLEERAQREARDIERVLGELKAQIEKEMAKGPPDQADLFKPDEVDQYERNRASLAKRLTKIPEEIAREREAVFARYKEPTPRLFPVAVELLFPEEQA